MWNMFKVNNKNTRATSKGSSYTADESVVDMWFTE